jgi:hypothetical protein
LDGKKLVPPGDPVPGGFKKVPRGVRYQWNFSIHIDNFPDILKPKLGVSNFKMGLTIYYF